MMLHRLRTIYTDWPSWEHAVPLGLEAMRQEHEKSQLQETEFHVGMIIHISPI